MTRLTVLVVLVALLGCEGRPTRAQAPVPSVSEPETIASAPPPYQQPNAPRLRPQGPSASPSFADLAEHADPAVVFVETQQARVGPGTQRMVGEGLGSGFVFDPNGLILTNYHVIKDATTIDVIFGGGRRMRADVRGTDARTDIAVLEVKEKGLSHLPFGDSDAIRVGDWVVAIGNPFGLSHTVSVGILSAKGRTHKDVMGLDPAGYYDFLQTDASINPGNSGGPLLDLKGRVVGMNSAIKPQANSIGFAVPVNMISDLLPALLAHGKVRRSALGLKVASVKDEDVARLKLSAKDGAIVTHVTPGGPGDRAGMKVDDVILAFGRTRGAGPHRLRWLASISGVGKKVPLRVARGGRAFRLDVTLGELPEPEEPPILQQFLP